MVQISFCFFCSYGCASDINLRYISRTYTVDSFRQDPEPSRPVYLDDELVDEVEVTDDDMQDPAMLAALAGLGLLGDKKGAGPSKSTPVLESSSTTGKKEPAGGSANSLGTQAQTGEKMEKLLEFDWGVPHGHAKKTGKETDTKGVKKEQVVKRSAKEEEENPFDGEYGEIGQTLDLVPPLLGPKDSAAPSQQRNSWHSGIMDLLSGDRSNSNASKEQTLATKDSQSKLLPPFPQVTTKPPERPPPGTPSTKPTVADATVNVQPATPSLQQEILALKRKALALKREGKAGEAREELRKAKLLERQTVQQGSQAVVLTSTVTAAGNQIYTIVS